MGRPSKSTSLGTPRVVEACLSSTVVLPWVRLLRVGPPCSTALIRVLQGTLPYTLGGGLYNGILHVYSGQNRSDGPSWGRPVDPPTKEVPLWRSSPGLLEAPLTCVRGSPRTQPTRWRNAWKPLRFGFRASLGSPSPAHPRCIPCLQAADDLCLANR